MFDIWDKLTFSTWEDIEIIHSFPCFIKKEKGIQDKNQIRI